MDTVYIETSIISYLRQKPSAQVVTAARHLLTHRWWNYQRIICTPEELLGDDTETY